MLDGGDLGELATHPDILEAFGQAPTRETRELVLLGGIRGGKSLLAAALAVRCTQRVNLSGGELRASDIPRVSICSIDLDKARVVLNDHLMGTLERSPFLRALFVRQSPDGLTLRHPSGRPVDIVVSAGKRAGGNLVSRWAAGVIFDEAPRMTGANDGVVNLEHARTSVYGRLLPGAAMLLAGSPWAPFGPVYELTIQHMGHPSAATTVAKCRGPLTNPVWWTPERCEALKAANPDAYTTDVECNFMAPVTSLLSPTVLEGACTLPDFDEPRNMLASYVGVMDPGTRGNAWTLVIATREGDVHRTVCHREWRGSSAKPLHPSLVLQECASILASYGLSWCYSDRYYIDANQDLANQHRLSLVQHDMDQAERARTYLQFRSMLIEGKCRMHASNQLRADLQRVERHVTPGGINIVLPHTADGRHCDYAPSVVVAITHSLPDLRKAELLEDEESKRTRERALRKLRGELTW